MPFFKLLENELALGKHQVYIAWCLEMANLNVFLFVLVIGLELVLLCDCLVFVIQLMLVNFL